MSKEIVDSFMYASTSKELWCELAEVFGESNGPLEFQLQREITLTKQNNLSVAAYYTKLKKLWDQLSVIMPFPNCSCEYCTCDLQKRLNEMLNKSRLMQFLMGLNDAFEQVEF